MEELIELFKRLGFTLRTEDLKKDHFYMSRFEPRPHLDAQGGPDHCQIRVIGYKHVEDEFSSMDMTELEDKINEWNKDYE